PMRVAFVLCHLEGRTAAEAALQVGCPEGTILSRLSRARQRLRARLTRRGLAPEPALPRSTPPADLVALTLRSAGCFAGGRAEGASVRVLSLTEGTLRDMFLSKLTNAASVLALFVIAGLGGLLAAAQTGDRVAPSRSDLPRANPLSGPKAKPAAPIN